MDTYEFFLFSKLFDIIIKNKIPYDDLYPITCYYYEQFSNQDNDETIGLYEAIQRFLINNKETIKKEL
tara:strand:+ start:47 stop:250 length:204 start_codon:yes stop_codon:yes gene_type:complete